MAFSKWSRAEVVLPFATAIDALPAAKHYRSTWVIASLASLRSTGHFEGYLRALRGLDRARPAAERQLLECVAGEWLPLPVAQLHYEACNALALTEGTVLELAKHGDGSDVRKAWHAQFIGTAKRETATPWTVLPQLHRLWERTADGGACAVYRLTPHEAVVQYVGCALFDIRHFGHAVKAVLCLLGAHVCAELVVTTLPQEQPGSAAYQMRWRPL